MNWPPFLYHQPTQKHPMNKTLFAAMIGLFASCGSSPSPAAKEAENEAWFKTCGDAQAYVLAKGAVKQAVAIAYSTKRGAMTPKKGK